MFLLFADRLSSPVARIFPARLWLIAAILGLTGCASVAPYQREDLSRPCMDLAQEASEVSFRAHVHDSREGATGGHGSTGGGCGCN